MASPQENQTEQLFAYMLKHQKQDRAQEIIRQVNSVIGKQMSQTCSKIIQDIDPNFKPTVSIILGSGLGEFSEHIKNRMRFRIKTYQVFQKLVLRSLW